MSMTKMFDPTIYSLQPLVTTPVTIPSQTSSTTSGSSNEQIVGDHDPSPSSDGHSGSSSLKDIVVVGDGEQQRNLKENQTDGNYEDLDTVSRKTSTTSEYTSLSDYTPENTVTRESSVTSTLRNDFPAEECIESSEALSTVDCVQDDSCVIEITDKLVAAVQETVSTQINENTRSPDEEVTAVQVQRTRKISRFLVTPSVVSIDCVNEGTIDEPQYELQSKSEGVYEDQLNAIQQQMYNEDGTVVTVGQFDASQQQIIFSQNNQPPGQGFSGDMIDANLMNATMPNKPLGPESINTLEQLKIGLENITHAHVQTKPKDAQPTVSEATKTTDEQIAPMVENTLTYADVTAGGTVQIMNEITGQQYEPTSDVFPQQHPIVQQLQSPQTGIQLVASSQQQTNSGTIISTPDQMTTSTSETMSQTASVYNSRRTSAELAAIEQYSKSTNDTVTLDNVESAESLRKLSQQGSVDKAEM